ncbi:hypothetical protein SAZ10_04420 [Mesorhizobium sp. BAC0120]|uniref:hypothetical protein n=1 Tax=Mesorhizobium sp. BAC0120 TaxID=3090670 RepID=UPI00298CCF41|nr:hypothetical protein [Mesorhizobium sp. BAC0120]MDW6021003.1 hypothetical protein [Mesorhizobium sp. BAC0120]
MQKGNRGKDPAEGSPKHIGKQVNQHGTGKEDVERDAEGQFVQSRHGAGNDGMASANPRPLSDKRDGDATFPVSKQGKRK